MEPLWSPVVATGGKRWQVRWAETGREQAETVAVGCDQLPSGPHGKEGVDGSSPSEGLEIKEIPANRLFLLSGLAPRSTSLESGTAVQRPPAFGKDSANRHVST